MSTPVLDREEYIEQAYFFRMFRERLEDNISSQEVLASIHEELLATTKLPMALEFLRGEILLKGRISDGMRLLTHYFTPFQAFVMTKAEEDKSRFDQKVALLILEREAEYRAGAPMAAGLFVFQFESIARNRLGYHDGMAAMSRDPLFDENWREWILKLRLRLGSTDFADLIYYRSEYYVQERRRRSGKSDYEPSYPVLFGIQEGRIAKANRGKDPLYMFAALQRQLGHPSVPRAKPKTLEPVIHPVLEQRLQKIEKQLQFLESETRGGGLDLSQFFVKPEEPRENGQE